MRTETAPAEAVPLQWPVGRPRTPSHKIARAKFHAQRRSTREGGYTFTERNPISLAAATKELTDELRMLGGKNVVLSSNLELRRDGLPRSGQRKPDDCGVAVYFTKDNSQLCFACDRWDRVEDNIVAVAKTIEALRGIERWGTGDMIRAAFTGFQALPPVPGTMPGRRWWEVFGIAGHSSTAEVEARFSALARQHHPDRGGTEKGFQEINDAYADFRRERGL
jgi:hypothetical protein